MSTTGELFLAPNDYWYQTSDNSGSLAVTVCPGETPCSVDATATVPANAETNQAVTFASTAAATGCAGSPTFVWSFGDGTATSTEPSPTHTYASAGSYTWTLTVQAGTATATRTGTIVVREPGACLPVDAHDRREADGQRRGRHVAGDGRDGAGGRVGDARRRRADVDQRRPRVDRGR